VDLESYTSASHEGGIPAYTPPNICVIGQKPEPSIFLESTKKDVSYIVLIKIWLLFMYENWKERNGISRQTKKKLEDQADRRKVLWRYTIAQSSFKRNQNYTFNFQLEPELEKNCENSAMKVQNTDFW